LSVSVFYINLAHATGNTAIHSALCLNNTCPSGASADDITVNHHIFILNANCKTKFADWVAYKVTRINLGGGTKQRRWRQDKALPADCTLSPQDYAGAYRIQHYDRGHQAPLASFSNNQGWAYTNYLSNITPQRSRLNRGAWKRLESAVRKLAKHYGTIYVVTGTLYDKLMPPLPHAHLAHRVPSDYFKVVAIQMQHTLKLTAFIMPQDAPQRADYCQYQVPLSDVEKRTNDIIFPDKTRLIETMLSELGC